MRTSVHICDTLFYIPIRLQFAHINLIAAIFWASRRGQKIWSFVLRWPIFNSRKIAQSTHRNIICITCVCVIREHADFASLIQLLLLKMSALKRIQKKIGGIEIHIENCTYEYVMRVQFLWMRVLLWWDEKKTAFEQPKGMCAYNYIWWWWISKLH